MVEYLIKRPMLLSGIGCVLTSIIAFYFKSLLILILFCMPFILGFMFYKKANIKLVIALVVIFIMSVSSIIEVRKAEDLQYYQGVTQSAKFTVCDVVYKGEDFYISQLEVIESDQIKCGVKIKAFHSPMILNSGQMITGDITIKEEDEEYKRDNYSEGIYLTGNLSKIKILSETDLVLNLGENIRNYIKTTLSKYTAYDVKATLCGLIFGNNDYFTNEFYNCVKASGVSHVMVVSGMHLSIIVAFLVFIMERICYSKSLKVLAILITVMIMWVICGFTMSILRAGITYVFMAFGLMFDRIGKPENTLGAAVSLILIASPFSILNISLQLSLLSTFGILVVAVPMMRYIKLRDIIKSKVLLWIVNSILLSVSAFIFTLPIVIYYFGGVSVVGVFTNLLISLPVTAVIIISVLAIFISLIFEPIALFLFALAKIITQYINYVIVSFGKLPFSFVSLPRNFSIFGFIIILLIICVLLACKKRINMLKLKEINKKIIEEGGGKLKWR